MAQAWYTYFHDNDFGVFPDPDGAFPKPDLNFRVPNGVTITALGSGIVSGIDDPNNASTPAFGHVVTVKLDKPHNALATHDAYLHLGSIDSGLSLGKRVEFGTPIGVTGPNAQNALVGYAWYPGDFYGFGPEWSKYIQTPNNVADQRLNPSSFVNGLSGSSSATGNIVTVRAFMDQVLANISSGSFSQPQEVHNFMIAWAQKEGGGVTNSAKFNPLNTKEQIAGSVDAGNGIQAYPDASTGIKATQNALNNGLYTALVHALSTGDLVGLGFTQRPTFAHAMSTDIANDLIIWDFGHGSVTDATNEEYPLSIMSLAGISNPSIVGGTISGSATGQSQKAIDDYGNKSLGEDTTGLTVGGATTNVLSGLEGLNTFFSNINSFFSDPLRSVKIVAGTILLIAGIVLLVKAFVPTGAITKAIAA